MYGLEAINAANGWAMALAGALIVIAGLAVLSFIISQLHKILSFFERSPDKASAVESLGDTQRALAIPERMPEDLEQVAQIYRALSESLDSPFSLQRLYALCVENRLPHPHLSLRSLRESGLLIPAGDGRFTWNP